MVPFSPVTLYIDAVTVDCNQSPYNVTTAVILFNFKAAISLFAIHRVTPICTLSSVQREKYIFFRFPILDLGHTIREHHKCIQRQELLLICNSIYFIEHECTPFLHLFGD